LFIAIIQIIFISDIKDLKIVIWTGWVMIGVMAITVLTNILFVFSYTIYQKIVMKRKKQVELHHSVILAEGLDSTISRAVSAIRLTQKGINKKRKL
jgi:hypothetical protein